MGAYLDKPVTDKQTESGSNANVQFAATSMQGWRVNQEDAHNCILDFDESCSMFAVYDGHGGSEVAQYTALNFPQFLKSKTVWTAGEYEKAIEESFLEFDDLLRSDEVMKELKNIAERPVPKRLESSDDDEDKAALYEEASMPLESILQRYGFFLRRDRNGTTTIFETKEDLAKALAASKKEAEENKKVEKADKAEENNQNGEKTEVKVNGDELKNGVDHVAENAKKRSSDSLPSKDDVKRCKPSQDDHVKTAISSEHHDLKEEETVSTDGCEQAPTASTLNAEDKIPVSSNGDALDKKEVEIETATTEKTEEKAADETEKKSATKQCLSSGENPQPSVTPETDSNSEQDEDYNDDDDELSEGEEEESELEELESNSYNCPTGDTPGEDSGTTACVVMLFKDKIIVGNAGDSRAVLCRGGSALDLSIDHKPEDEIERRRIESAGGEISVDGRVNGGLNLSRALGDHFYKKNKSIPLKDQMISALPDIREFKIDESDEFLIVACDGIWNSMSSQEVIDFVRQRLNEGVAIGDICNQICEHCLSPNSAGDGTGCDNMTVIVAQILRPAAEINAPS